MTQLFLVLGINVFDICLLVMSSSCNNTLSSFSVLERNQVYESYRSLLAKENYLCENMTQERQEKCAAFIENIDKHYPSNEK